MQSTKSAGISTDRVLATQTSAHNPTKHDLMLRYSDGLFSDPIKKKNWLGLDVLSAEHKKLIGHLRHECVHLSHLSETLRQKVNAQDIRHTAQERQISELNAALAARNTAFSLLSAELDDANSERRNLEVAVMENVALLHGAVSAQDKKRNRLSVLSQIDVDAHEANLGEFLRQDKGKGKATEG